MSGLSIDVALTITRIRTTFIDSLGNKLSGIGTGFWIKTNNNKTFLVTNKHNLHTSRKSPCKEEFKLYSIEIQMRKRKEHAFLAETQFFQIDSLATKLILGENIDLALIANPTFLNINPDFAHIIPLGFSSWAPDENFFTKNIRMCSEISFVGYPQDLFDIKWKLPIARSAIIASVPEIDFSHKDISSEGVILVSGLSFQGSSGSPVFSYVRGTKINVNNGSVESDNYCPQKLLGVMTGHLQVTEESLNKEYFNLTRKEEEFLRLTGFSYFINSFALIKLIDTHEMSLISN